MYSERLKALATAYKLAEKTNAAYERAIVEVNRRKSQVAYLQNLNQSIITLERLIAEQEEKWQRGMLDMLEASIAEHLAYVFPHDGYTVKLSTRLLRGKIHIEASAQSYFAGAISGEIDDSQGRLFQQIVSFAALMCVMKILNVNTVYIDEAFSGVSEKNSSCINKLLKSYEDRGCNIILIAQMPNMAADIEANVLRLSRSLDNKTYVEVSDSGT